MNFGKNLLDVLEEKNLKQSDLAKLLNSNSASISRYIQGVNIPSIDFLFKAAEALNVSADRLLFGINKEVLPTEYKNIINILDQLDERELIKLEGFIENEFEKIISRRSTSSGLNNTGWLRKNDFDYLTI